MADDYDPFNLRKHPGYYAELVQERDPTHDVAASYVKNHQYDGGILGQLERNPHGLGDSPLPFDPSGAELRSTSEGGSAFTERPKDHLQPVAELISPTLGAFGAGQMAGTAYKEAGEGDYQEAGMSLAPLLAGMVVPGAPKGVRGPKAITREIDARGFYSPSLEAVKGLGQETGTVQQFRSMLLKAGGKPKELDAVGFDRAFPDPNAKVSRGDIEQYLRDNRVQLGENRRGEAFDNDTFHDMGYEEAKHYAESRRARYEDYSTPGGIPGSYREVVTTLPDTSGFNVVPHPDGKGFALTKPDGSFVSYDNGLPSLWEKREDAITYGRGFHDKNSYTSSHWPGITNPLLHYRVKDFVSGDRAAPADTSRLLRSHNAEAGRIDPRLVKEEDGVHVYNDGKVHAVLQPNADGSATVLAISSGDMRKGNARAALERIRGMYGAVDAQDVGPAGTRSYSFWQKMHGEGLLRSAVDEDGRTVFSPSPQSGSGEGTTSGGAFRSPESSLPSKTRVLDEIQADGQQNAHKSGGIRDSAALPGLKADLEKATEAVRGTQGAIIKATGGKDWSAAHDIASRSDDPQIKQLMANHEIEYNARLDLMNKVKGAETGLPESYKPWYNTSDWVDLGLKQALIDAAKDPSVNRLAWAPGKVQADRYNLKNTISGIRYSPETKSLQVTRPYDDAGKWYGFEGSDNITPEALPGLVGKDLAAQLLAAPKQAMGRGSPYDAHTLTDLGSIEIGGHGMRSFYGDMTPEGYQSGIVGTRLQKLVKGLDPEAARVEPHQLMPESNTGGKTHMGPEGATVRMQEGFNSKLKTVPPYPSIPMTKAMRDKILKEGLPLFNVAALSALINRIMGQGPSEEDEQ